MAPARYSPSNTDVTMEIPASRSEPNSRRKSFLEELDNERNAAEREGGQQRNLRRAWTHVKSETQKEMSPDRHDGN